MRANSASIGWTNSGGVCCESWFVKVAFQSRDQLLGGYLVLIYHNSENVSVLEEQLEFEMFEMETSKSLFTGAFTKYSMLMNENYPESNIYEDDISQAWNEYAIASSKIISGKSRDVSSDQILVLKEGLSDAEQSLNQALFGAIGFIEPQIENRQQVIENLVDNTTIQILIALNIFIASTLIIKYLITKIYIGLANFAMIMYIYVHYHIM